MSQEKNIKKELDSETLTDYDLCELHIKCHEVVFSVSSRLDMETKRSFEIAKVLWEKTIEARDKYRKANPVRSM